MIGCNHVWQWEPDLVQSCAICDVFKFVVDEKALKARVETLEGALRIAGQELAHVQSKHLGEFHETCLQTATGALNAIRAALNAEAER